MHRDEMHANRSLTLVTPDPTLAPAPARSIFTAMSGPCPVLRVLRTAARVC